MNFKLIFGDREREREKKGEKGKHRLVLISGLASSVRVSVHIQMMNSSTAMILVMLSKNEHKYVSHILGVSRNVLMYCEFTYA